MYCVVGSGEGLCLENSPTTVVMPGNYHYHRNKSSQCLQRQTKTQLCTHQIRSTLRILGFLHKSCHDYDNQAFHLWLLCTGLDSNPTLFHSGSWSRGGQQRPAEVRGIRAAHLHSWPVRLRRCQPHESSRLPPHRSASLPGWSWHDAALQRWCSRYRPVDRRLVSHSSNTSHLYQ